MWNPPLTFLRRRRRPRGPLNYEPRFQLSAVSSVFRVVFFFNAQIVQPAANALVVTHPLALHGAYCAGKQYGTFFSDQGVLYSLETVVLHASCSKHCHRQSNF